MQDTSCPQNGHSIKNPTADLQGYLTKAEIAPLLHIETCTLERWMKRGAVPYLKIGRGRRASVLFNWPAVQAHLESEFGIGGRA